MIRSSKKYNILIYEINLQRYAVDDDDDDDDNDDDDDDSLTVFTVSMVLGISPLRGQCAMESTKGNIVRQICE